MLLPKSTPCQKIEIWSPRYKDRTVLIAKHKIGNHNEIVFTKAKHLAGQSFYLSGSDAATCPIDSNGTIKCYAVPMDMLQPLERA